MGVCHHILQRAWPRSPSVIFEGVCIADPLVGCTRVHCKAQIRRTIIAYRYKRATVVYRGVELDVVISEDQECFGPGIATITYRAGVNVASIYPSVSVNAHEWLIAGMVNDWLNRSRVAQIQLGLSPLTLVA